MPLTGEYAPSTSAWARKQAERYEATHGVEAANLRGRPITTHELHEGDELRLGRTRITYRSGAFVPPPAHVRRRGVIRPADKHLAPLEQRRREKGGDRTEDHLLKKRGVHVFI